MAETFTQKDMTMAVHRLEIEAQVCGLLQNETLYYTNGSTGVAATVEIRRSVDGQWEYRGANWLPRFTPKDNKRTQYKMMYAAADALRAASEVISGLKADYESEVAGLKSEISGLKVDFDYLQSETGGTL